MMATTVKKLQKTAWIGAVAFAVSSAAGSAVAQERGSINVFADVNYGGESTTFTASMPNLTDNGWNDKISSIQVAPGEAWEVCVDANFANRCQIVRSNVPDLRSMGLNDQITSIRPVGAGFR